MIEWLNIEKDGIYTLTKTRLRRKQSTLYISGDSPKGSFTFGILDDQKKFVPSPRGSTDISTIIHHGRGVCLVLEVRGYIGGVTRVGHLVGKRRRAVVVLVSILGPLSTFIFDTIIDRITKKF